MTRDTHARSQSVSRRDGGEGGGPARAPTDALALPLGPGQPRPGEPSRWGQGPWAQDPPGLYGPRGWSVRAGVWRLLAPWAPAPGRGGAPGWHDGKKAGAALTRGPVTDYVPFRGLDHATARRLLRVLPGPALEDRQNRAPCLGALLAACAAAEGRVRLSGYGIGPQREDERVSVEALWVGDADLVREPVGGPGASLAAGLSDLVSGLAGEPLAGSALAEAVRWRETLWRRIAQRYHLGACPGCGRLDDGRQLPGLACGRGASRVPRVPDEPGVPDEVRFARPSWAGGAPGWWLWWD